MPRPEPGAASFLPTLIAHLHDQPFLNTWNFDSTLFSVILIALIVRRGGLIVDVVREDGKTRSRQRVDRVIKVVSAMTESIFGRITRHVRFSSGSEPEDVPRLILGDRLHEEGFERHGPFPTSHASYVPDTHQPPHLEPLHPAQHGTTSLDPIHHALALPETLIVSGLEQAPSPAQIKLISIVSTSCVQLDGQTYVPPQPQGWMTIWIRDAHGPEVPSWVVDHFSCSTAVYPKALDLPPSGLIREALIPPDFIRNLYDLLPYTHLHPPLQIHISNLFSALSFHPRFRTVLTARAVLTFPSLVRAHRLLSSPFSLPSSWEEGLRRGRIIDGGDEEMHFGLRGGVCGADTWGMRAGEEPEVRDLREFGKRDEKAGEGLGEDGEDWYAGLRDVQGAWGIGLKHRVRWREEGDGVMWLLKQSAQDVGLKGQVGGSKSNGSQRDIDKILEEILMTV